MVKLVSLHYRRGEHKKIEILLGRFEIPDSEEFETQKSILALKSLVRRFATEQHEKARKKKDRKILFKAEKLYQTYLVHFFGEQISDLSTPKEEIEIRMYLGEVQFDLKKYASASAQYQTVFESGDPRYSQEAGLLWTVSLNELLKKEYLLRKNQLNQKSSLSDLERKWVFVSRQVGEKISNTQKKRYFLLRSSQILAGYKETDEEAISEIKKLIKKYPSSSEAVTAAILYMQIYGDRIKAVKEEKDDFLEVATQFSKAIDDIQGNQELLAYSAKNNRGLSKLIEKNRLDVKIGQIEVYEKNKESEKAGEQYEDLARKSQNPKTRLKGYQGAIRSFLDGNYFELADKSAFSWLTTFPKNRNAQNASMEVASQLFVQQMYQKSAERFFEIGKLTGNRVAFLTSAAILEATEKYSNAKSVLSELVRQFPGSKKNSEIYYRIAGLSIQEKRTAEIIQDSERCGDERNIFGVKCLLRLGTWYMKRGELSKAKTSFQKLLKSSRGFRTRAANERSLAYYYIANVFSKQTTLSVMKLPEEKLKASINERTRFIQSLQKLHQKAIQTGGLGAVYSLNHLAEEQIRFADEIDRIAPLKSFNEKQKRSFQKTLSSFSTPLRKKAKNLWRTAKKINPKEPVID